MNDEFPDHREVVAEVRENAEGMGEGVVHDTLIDAKIEVEDYHYKMSDIVVALDAIADNQGMLPEEVQQNVTEMHKAATEMEEWLAGLSAAFQKEVNEL